MLKVRFVALVAASFLLLTPVPALAAGACAALMQTPAYTSMDPADVVSRYTVAKEVLRRNLVGAHCTDDEIIAMMQKLGWTVEGGTVDHNNVRYLMFCDRREGWWYDLARRVVEVRCRGSANFELRGDKIIDLIMYGEI